MGKKIAIAVAMIALMASSASAAVQNVKVGGSLKTTSVIRNSFDLGASTTSNKNQNVILSQAALDIEADLTDNVSVVIGLVDERLWGTSNAGSSNSDLKVDTAYVTLEEFLYAPLTLTIGRQPLVYGDALIIGDGDSTTGLTTPSDITGGINFDAIKAELDYDPLMVDLFAAKVSEGITVTDDEDDDVDLYGVNVAY